MSKLTRGEVAITLDGAELTLKPTLACFSKLAAQYDNYGELLSKIARGNVPAVIFVLRHGLGWGDKEAKGLAEKVMNTGIIDLTDPLSDFVFRLFNNGLSVDEMQAKQITGGKADDAKAAKAEEEEEDPLLAG
jgi:hypothetical protein